MPASISRIKKTDPAQLRQRVPPQLLALGLLIEGQNAIPDYVLGTLDDALRDADKVFQQAYTRGERDELPSPPANQPRSSGGPGRSSVSGFRLEPVTRDLRSTVQRSSLTPAAEIVHDRIALRAEYKKLEAAKADPGVIVTAAIDQALVLGVALAYRYFQSGGAK